MTRSAAREARWRRRPLLRGLASAAAAASCRRQADAAAPNVLFLLTDQHRYPFLSAYGHPSVRTPNMDRIAKRGALFDHAYVVSPQCSPARASIMTGLYPSRHGVLGNMRAAGGTPLSRQIPALGPLFDAAGYDCSYVGKWHLGPEGPRGFSTFENAHGGELTGTADAALSGIATLREPFLLFVSFLDPHRIYSFRDLRHQVKRDDRLIRAPANVADDLRTKPGPQREMLEQSNVQRVRKAAGGGWVDYLNVYEHLIEQVDEQVGRLLNTLDARRPERETVVVLTADHGDFTGAHGLPFKGPACYDELLRVPLAISAPGIPPGQRVDDLVLQVDLLPTLCGLSGVPAPAAIDGTSLLPRLRAGEPLRRDHFVVQYHGQYEWVTPIRAVRTRSWKYTRYLVGGEELYDLRRDPGELRNVAEQAVVAAKKQQLADLLAQWMERTSDPFLSLQATDRSGKPLTAG